MKELVISGNYTIGDDRQLYSMLTNAITMLEELHMIDTKLSPGAAAALFKALKNNNKLKKLYIAYNGITSDASDAITTALKNNSCLVALSMWRNPLWTGESIVSMLNGLKNN